MFAYIYLLINTFAKALLPSQLFSIMPQNTVPNHQRPNFAVTDDEAVSNEFSSDNEGSRLVRSEHDEFSSDFDGSILISADEANTASSSDSEEEEEEEEEVMHLVVAAPLTPRPSQAMNTIHSHSPRRPPLPPTLRPTSRNEDPRSPTPLTTSPGERLISDHPQHQHYQDAGSNSPLESSISNIVANICREHSTLRRNIHRDLEQVTQQTNRLVERLDQHVKALKQLEETMALEDRNNLVAFLR